MSDFFLHGNAVRLIMLVIVIELVWLALRRRTDLFSALLPGFLILWAMWEAQVGATWQWVAGLLALSLPAHLYDLRRRLRPPT
ncbi:hypothetical protein KX816_01060 [Sphingosinicellaceae bacterium]|nr:hypothetical protein KX816_01060 [Sphingosinicellaceae bacterium]